MKRTISLLAGSELFILLSNFYSFGFYINLQIAFLSSLFIILGSMYAYKKMVIKKAADEDFEDDRDLLDAIDDPHELYDESKINETPVEELDLKAIVKEEKKKIKMLNLRDAKKGASAGFSMFRLVPYLFLILGFIALKNNEVLDIAVYLPSLLAGIIVGSYSGRELFKL